MKDARSRVDQRDDKSQLMGSAPCCTSNSFVRLKGRDPKKPYRADMGEGCEDLTIGTLPSMALGIAHRVPIGSPPADRRAPPKLRSPSG